MAKGSPHAVAGDPAPAIDPGRQVTTVADTGEFHGNGTGGVTDIRDKDISLTFAKGMGVLKAFDAAHTHLSIADIVGITGYDRASVRRLVLTLVSLGYVRQEGRVFSLTPHVLILAGGFLQGRGFGKTIHPVLKTCSREIGEAISLAMIDGGDAVYVAHAGVEEYMVSLGFTIGSRIPLVQTAIGRALLAAGDPAAMRARVEDATLVRYTVDTLMDPDAIWRAVEDAAAKGYAFVDNEFEPGVAALAVPVGRPGAARAAIGMSAARPTFHSGEYFDTVLRALRQCAVMLEPLLGE